MRVSLITIILGLLLFSACSNSNVQEIKVDKILEEINDSKEIIPEVIELTPLQIKEEKLQNISIEIEELQSSENNTLGYGLIFGCNSLRYTYGQEKVTKCEEVKEQLDVLYHKRNLIETNTKDIITYSSEIVETPLFILDVLNINPTMIRFNLDQEENFKIFVTDDNYECLFLDGTFGPGENIILNKNNCYINSTKEQELIIEYNDKITFEKITPDADKFDFFVYKSIIAPSHPTLYGSNVTWELQILLNNSNNKPYKISELKAWISQRDVNGSLTDPNTIDNDPISGELLSKTFDNEIILKPNSEKLYTWQFNYSDLPSPFPWSEIDYYYEVK